MSPNPMCLTSWEFVPTWGPPLFQKCNSQLSPKPVTPHEGNLYETGGITSWSSWPSCCPWKMVRAIHFFIIFPVSQPDISAERAGSSWLNSPIAGDEEMHQSPSWLGPGQQVLQSPGYRICKEFSSSSGVWYQCEGTCFRKVPLLSSSSTSVHMK